MTQVGTGKYTYELIQDFPKLPPGESLGIVSTVATDSQDRVYVFQRQDPPVMVFDRHGNYLNCWGIGAITDPHGMTIVDDIVYITDRSDSVAVTFTLDGKPLQVLGKRGVHSDTGCEKPGDLVPRAAGPFNYPTEMVPSPSGDLYVSDGYRNARVHRFTRDGQLINSWGAPGKTAPGHFHLPHSVLAAPDGQGLRLRPHQPACANFLCRRGVPQHVDWHGRAKRHRQGQRWRILHLRTGGRRRAAVCQYPRRQRYSTRPLGDSPCPRVMGGFPR